MSEPTTTVVDLLDRSSLAQPQTVAYRIERRLVVLRSWLADGMPMGKKFPSSLNAARLWDDEEIGMQPIRSPNDFTTTHSEHGRSVKEIGYLLTALALRYDRPTGQFVRPAPVRKFDRAEFDRVLEKAVSQWHAERDQRLLEQRRASDENTRSTCLLEENAEKDRLIAELRRQLNAQNGLRAVE